MYTPYDKNKQTRFRFAIIIDGRSRVAIIMELSFQFQPPAH